MNEVGRRYETGEYWISDLMMAGMIFKQASGLLSPLPEGGGGPSRTLQWVLFWNQRRLYSPNCPSHP